MRLPLAPLLLLTLICVVALPVQGQPSPDTPDARYADAFALFDAGLYGEAARAFDLFRNDFPAHAREPDALFFGAQAELAAGRDTRASELFSTFRRRFPNHPLAPRARLALGEYFFAQGEYEQSISSFREALDEPQPPEDAARALLMMGQAGLRLGRVDSAIDDLSRIVERYPRSTAAPRALYTIGLAEMERENHAAAAEAFGRLGTRYRRTPDDRAVGLGLAEALLRSGQFSRVADEVDRRLADMPSLEQEGGLPLSPSVAAERRALRDRAHFLAAEALLRQGIAESAEERFREIDEEGPYGARAQYGLGRIAFQRQEWAAAGEHFDRAAAGAPAIGGSDALAAEALYYAGLSYRRIARLVDAEDRFTRAVEKAPEGPYADVALFEHGILLYSIRRWDEAVTVFERLLDAYPTSTHAGEAARMLGETFAALGDFRRAEEATARAERLGAASPELTGEVDFQRGYEAVRNGDFAAAESILIGVYSADPRGNRAGEALFWAAEAAFQLGQRGQRAGFDRAQERFTTFLNNFPDHRQRDAARYALAWTYFRKADYGRAAQAFERFLAAYRADSEIVPYTSDARLRLADSYFALRNWTAAAAAYRLVDGPGRDYARFQIGQSLANAGQLEEAVTAFSQLLTDFPDSPLRPQARYAIGDIRFQQENYDRAIEIFQEVIAQYPASPIAARAQFAIGDARFNQGRLQDAVTAYRAVLDRYPRSPLVPDALSAIELALGGLGREDEVPRVLEQFEARNPGAEAVEEMRFRQAEARFQRGDLQGAISDLNQLVQRTRDPELRPPALLYLGRAHADLGDFDNARRHFRRLIDEHPRSPLVGEASRRLGQVLLQERRFADALPLFRTAVERADSPTEGAEARLGQAASLIGLQRYAEAEPVLNAVVAAAPARGITNRARIRLADVYEATNRSARASSLYEEVARDDDGPVGAEAASRLVAAQLARGDALAVISSTDRIRPEQRFAGYPERVAEILLARARAFKILGEDGRAQEVFDRLVRTYSDTPAAAVARRERDA